jgi:hypothetical protein
MSFVFAPWDFGSDALRDMYSLVAHDLIYIRRLDKTLGRIEGF